MIATGKESTKSTPQNFELGALRQFGYNFFRAGADPFGAMGDIPVGPDYLLGTGDRINVTVWGSIDASYPLEVNRSGEIVVPKVGTIKVAGVAFGQLHQLLNGQFSRIFRNFQLNVTMGKLRMVKVYVVGEVATPGDYTITSLSTLLNALAAAGGPTHNGSLRAIAIKRDGKLVDTIDLYDFFLRGDKSRDIKLQPGDTVFVPTIGPVVGIAGNVRRPAIFELKGEKNLKDLLVLADGIVPTGYLQRLQIMGVEANEKKSVTDVSLDPKTSGKDLDSLAGGISIKDMDLVKIFPIDNTLRGYAHLEGYVLRPGDYAVRPAMRVEQLLSPDNLLPEYFRELGQITRLMPPDYHAELLFFNVAQAMEKIPEQNPELKEFDVVRIFSRWEMEEMPKVKISGEVQRPGEFQLFTNMRAGDLLSLAGKPKKNAFLKMAEVRRYDYSKATITPHSFYINLEEVLRGNPDHNVILQPRDEIVVKSWFVREEYPVAINGEITNPGNFRYVDNMTVRDLVFEAGNVKKSAYLKMAEIKRHEYLKINITPHSFYIDLEEALTGNPLHNIKLQPLDEVIIKKWFPGEEYPVIVGGEVTNPGSFRFVTGMTVRDLILEAGNVKYSAYLKSAEINRRKIVNNSISSHSVQIDLEKVLANEPSANISLQPFDTLTIHKIPNWIEEVDRYVTVTGEVVFPGTYPIYKGEHISDVLQRSGGLTDKAYLRGVKFTRRSVMELQQKRMDEVLAKTERDVMQKQATLSSVASSKEELEATKAALDALMINIAKLKLLKAEGRVVLKLENDFKNSENNLLLEGGDRLDVPPRPSVVNVLGEVYNPNAFVYMDGKDLGWYLDKTGGALRDAEVSDMYVIQADGSVYSRQQQFFGWFLSGRTEPGDTLVVPQKLEKIAWMRDIKDITQILANVAVTTGTIMLGLR